MRSFLILPTILFSLHFLAGIADAASSAAQEAAALGASQIAQGDFDAAVKSFEKAAKLEPANAAFHRQLGDAFNAKAMKAGPSLSAMSSGRKARAAWEKAIELDPSDIESRYSVMQFYVMAPAMVGGSIDKAQAQATEIKKLDPVRGALALEIIYTNEKKYREAFAALDEVLKARPDDYLANYRFGRLAAISGQRLDAGLVSLKKCLTLTPAKGTPDHSAAHWRSGVILEQQGDKAAARTAYQASLSLSPDFKEASDSLKKMH